MRMPWNPPTVTCAQRWSYTPTRAGRTGLVRVHCACISHRIIGFGHAKQEYPDSGNLRVSYQVVTDQVIKAAIIE